MLTVCSTSCWKWLSGRFIAQHFQGLLWDWEVWCFLDPCNMVGWCLHIIRPPFVTVTFESWQWFAVTSASSLKMSASHLVSKVVHGHSFPLIPWVEAVVLHSEANRTNLCFSAVSLFPEACVHVVWPVLLSGALLELWACRKLQPYLPLILLQWLSDIPRITELSNGLGWKGS